MKVLINLSELTVLNCYAYRYSNGKLVLRIEIPQSDISHDDLKTLLKENAGDIIAIKDDGTTETFTGFHYQVRISDSETPEGVEIHSCEIECVSENEFQIGILQRTVAQQNAVIESQNQTINAQASEIALLNDTLLEVLMG